MHESQAETAASLETLLAGSSRTFALSIPFLPGELRSQVTVSYLLFRIADTFEDEPAWGTEAKLEGLAAVDHALAQGPRNGTVNDILGLLSGVELTKPGYTELMRNSGKVMDAFESLCPAARDAIARHLRRTIEGMARHLRDEEPVETVSDVRRYCYYVAGIVGEMLTDLFALRTPTLADDRELYELAPRFGEALQLVNILRDSDHDAHEGRVYIPSAAERPELFGIAKNDLDLAARYVERLAAGGAEPGVIAFNALNLRLAVETIALVEQQGPGAKIGRDAVKDIHAEITVTMRAAERVAS